MKVLVPVCLFWGLVVLPVKADIIYFKDGMRSICQEKAWEEGDQVKCEYEDWVISYKKEDVLRIEKTVSKKSTAKIVKVQKDKFATNNNKKIKNLRSPAPKGPVFYDPRRTYKYWTGKNSKHKSYSEAIQALAKKYNRPSAWIQANMGDTNDLAEIHQNLTNPNINLDSRVPYVETTKPSGIAFYNPRRKFPYWTSKESKHKNYKSAIRALAQQYAHPPEWIQANMGTSNDLNEIHRELATRAKTN